MSWGHIVAWMLCAAITLALYAAIAGIVVVVAMLDDNTEPPASYAVHVPMRRSAAN